MNYAEQVLCHVDTCRDGCTRETGCQGHAWRRAASTYYQKIAETLVENMAREGYVLTVEQEPLRPLAMGHYRTVVRVQPQRPSTAFESAAPAPQVPIDMVLHCPACGLQHV